MFFEDVETDSSGKKFGLILQLRIPVKHGPGIAKAVSRRGGTGSLPWQSM